MDTEEIVHEPNSFDIQQRPVAVLVEKGINLQGLIKLLGFLDKLRDCLCFKKDSAPSSELVTLWITML
jgi:hypothetical protein